MDIDTDTGLETKDGLPVESVVTHAEMMRAFEEFKLANDARTAHMERRSADVLLDEKLTRIDRTIDAYGRRLDEIALKNARPAFGRGQANGGLCRAQGGI
jgi:predicted phage gp36 major capsid-like protein